MQLSAEQKVLLVCVRRDLISTLDGILARRRASIDLLRHPPALHISDSDSIRSLSTVRYPHAFLLHVTAADP